MDERRDEASVSSQLNNVNYNQTFNRYGKESTGCKDDCCVCAKMSRENKGSSLHD